MGKQTEEYAEFQKRNAANNLIRKYATQLGINKKEYRSFPSDPNAPKRALSSYMCYANDVRPSLFKKNPDSSIGEIGKVIGGNWKKLSSAQKAKYEKMAAANKTKYEKAVAKYQ